MACTLWRTDIARYTLKCVDWGAAICRACAHLPRSLTRNSFLTNSHTPFGLQIIVFALCTSSVCNRDQCESVQLLRRWVVCSDVLSPCRICKLINFCYCRRTINRTLSYVDAVGLLHLLSYTEWLIQTYHYMYFFVHNAYGIFYMLYIQLWLMYCEKYF